MKTTSQHGPGFTIPHSAFRIPHSRHSAFRIPRSRSAFTLIELLVAMTIIILLGALVLAFYPSRAKRQAAQGADQLQTFIASAKSRALRDNAPRGVRFLISPDGNYREFQYIEQPEPYAPAGVTMTIAQGATTATFTQSLAGSVEVGDMLEIMHGSGSIHRVTGMNAGATVISLASSPPGAATAPLTISQNYRFIRQPRALMGEPNLQLPRDVLVDTTRSLNLPSAYASAQRIEILFSPSGQVINARGGRIVLWVRDENNVSSPTLLTIYTRTGGCAAHPEGPPGQPYQFTQDGRSSGQ